MDGHTFISWNIPNLITVILMGTVGYFVIKGAQKVIAAKQGS